MAGSSGEVARYKLGNLLAQASPYLLLLSATPHALELRQEAAEHIGIENIRRSRLQKLQKEKANIEAQHRKGSQVYPDFRLIMMARLEA